MKVKGELIEVLDINTGQGKNGEWRKGGIIIETKDDKYSKKIAIDLWNEDIDKLQNEIGDTISVSINIESREYNGKWFTNVAGWKIESEEGVTTQKSNTPKQEQAPIGNAQEPDDLPF